MGTFEYVMIYVLSWWMVLMAILSVGSELPDQGDEKTYHSAPKNANILRKLLITTVLAAIATLLISWGIRREVFTLWFEPF